MIDGYDIATIPDLTGQNDVKFEINWREMDKDVVRIEIGGKKSVVKLADLYKVVFDIVGPEEQSDLLPVRKTTIRKYIRQHRIRAGKNIKKGDEMVVNCEIDVPLTVEEGLRKDVFKKKSLFKI